MRLAFYNKADTFGALASGLCIIHCLATPFLFVVHSCANCSQSAPVWWQALDYIFLVISFFAVYRSVKNTKKKVMKPMLWLSWFGLLITMLNVKLQIVPMSESVMHASAMILVVLHLYNLFFCQCKNKSCCIHDQTATSEA